MPLLLLAGCAYIWYAYSQKRFRSSCTTTPPLRTRLALYRHGPAIFAGVLFAALLLLSLIFRLVSLRHRGEGLWSSRPMRRMIGLAAGGAVFVFAGIPARPSRRVFRAGASRPSQGAWRWATAGPFAVRARFCSAASRVRCAG